MREQQDNRSLGDLFSDLARDTGTLVRQEVTLATTEMTQKATRVGKEIGILAVGGAVLYAGFLALLAALIIGLGQLALPWWLSAFLVALVVLAVGGVMVWQALAALKRTNLVPEQTIDTLKEDAEWAKAQTQ